MLFWRGTRALGLVGYPISVRDYPAMDFGHGYRLVEFGIRSGDHGHMAHFSTGAGLLFAIKMKEGLREVQHIIQAAYIWRAGRSAGLIP